MKTKNYKPLTQEIAELVKIVETEMLRLGRQLTKEEIVELVTSPMVSDTFEPVKTKINKKVFCKRHYPIRFALVQSAEWIAIHLIPWLFTIAVCVYVAMWFVNQATGGEK
jgi:hypothetical protein